MKKHVCINCQKPTITKKSSYCMEHFEQLLIGKVKS